MDVFFMSPEKISLEEISDLVRINFPRDLNLEESEDLLKYLAEELRADVDYNISYHKSVNHRDKGVKISDGALKITGQIDLLDNSEKFDYFTIRNSDFIPETHKVGMLEFSRVPGWDINDYREEVRELWGDVRKAVGIYFESRS